MPRVETRKVVFLLPRGIRWWPRAHAVRSTVSQYVLRTEHSSHFIGTARARAQQTPGVFGPSPPPRRSAKVRADVNWSKSPARYLLLLDGHVCSSCSRHFWRGPSLLIIHSNLLVDATRSTTHYIQHSIKEDSSTPPNPQPCLPE